MQPRPRDYETACIQVFLPSTEKVIGGLHVDQDIRDDTYLAHLPCQKTFRQEQIVETTTLLSGFLWPPCLIEFRENRIESILRVPYC